MNKSKITIAMTIISSAIAGAMGSLLVTSLFMQVINGKTDWGSIAEWVGSIGTIGGLFFVVYQIQSSKEQFLEAHSAKFNPYIRIIAHESEPSGKRVKIKQVSPVFKLLMGNDGNVAGSVAFSGVCATDFYNSRDTTKIEDCNEIISKSVDTRVQYGCPQPDPSFHRIEAKGTGEEWLSLKEKDFQKYFPDETCLTVVYTDTHGKLYPQNIEVNYDADLLKEDRVKD